MCKSQPTWPVHLSGWHHCTHTPSISARRHRTMLLLVINIHTSLTAPHTLPTSAPPPQPRALAHRCCSTHAHAQTNTHTNTVGNPPLHLCTPWLHTQWHGTPIYSLIHTWLEPRAPNQSHINFLIVPKTNCPLWWDLAEYTVTYTEAASTFQFRI